MNKVLLFGDVVLDEFIFCEIKRKNPESSDAPLLTIFSSETKDGGAGNVLANLESLGVQVEQIPSQNYSRANLSVKTRYFLENKLLYRVDDDKFFYIDLTALEHFYAKRLQNFDYLVLSDYGKGALAESKLFIELAKRNNPNIRIFVDPKKAFTDFKGAYCLKCNVEEFEKYWGEFTDENIQRLAQENEHDLVVVTLGSNGVKYYYDGKVSSFRGIPVDAVDVTGAGDCFLAALVRNHTMGYPVDRCIASANRAAAKSVTQIGTYSLKPEDCDQVVVFTNGCFDLLHEGHLHLLKEAEKLGDRLVIAINSDSSVKRLKGDSRPINNEATRIADLWNSGYSNVVIFEEETPINILDSIRPDFVVKGSDYKEDEVISGGAHVKIVPLLEGYSTTKMIEGNHGNR